jgi:hypothetical protein
MLVRCGPKPEAEESATDCFHHEKLFLSKYQLLLLPPQFVIYSKAIKKC